MIEHASQVESAAELTIKAAQIRAGVVRALALWETWIIVASIAYLAIRFVPWARAGFPVNRRVDDAFAFYAEER